MYYHVLIEIEETYHWWMNYDYEELVGELLIPFINKQIGPVSHYGVTAIFNFATVSYFMVYKTSEALDLPDDDDNDVREMFFSSAFTKNECTQEIIDHFLVSTSATESKSLLQTLFLPTKRQVFVIMKFGDKLLNSAYEGVIKPIAKKYRYKPLRIDEVQDSGRITNQILEEIAQSAVIIADLTGERPNCYYEAGFAHAIGKEIIFTVRKGSLVHFDLAGHRFIEWETEDDLRKSLLKRFRAIKERGLQKGTSAT